MQTNTNKTKLIIFCSIVLAVVLFVLSISLVVAINKKKKLIADQNQQIETLNNKLNYYENIKDIETGDGNIIVEGE